MSLTHHTHQRSTSSRSQGSRPSEPAQQLPSSQSQDDHPSPFDPCASTASFFLHAQNNTIVCLHHDTLAIERCFEKHREKVLLISADNISERGAGRLVVSYDVGQTAIVWDLFTGDEVARFASYEHIHVATWMRDGCIAFGNAQGNVILFDPSTSEHVSARTIFDPVTALAPAPDCRTFAIGYMNGSILIATIQPFNILHTLNTSRGPSPITGLAWHGSSSKQKTEMLATQTSDGDLRVWSVSKPPIIDAPRIIRMLGGNDSFNAKRSWFSWSKNGRLIQFVDGQTRSWDVRTKKVTCENVPTIEEVTAISNYGPTASLFTVGSNHMIQQYDINPQSLPTMVANVQHGLINAPPTPPDSIARETPPPIDLAAPSARIEHGSSEDEGASMSPLEKINREMKQIEEEMRESQDQVGPLSPISSRASSRASMGSASSYGRKTQPRPKEKGFSSKSSEVSSEGTVFSVASSTRSSTRSGNESMSIRSGSSTTSSRYQPSSLRQQTLRSPDEPTSSKNMDLFPFIKTRLGDVKFRTPQYGSELTPDILRREMLSVIFGWDDDIETLVRDEQSRHKSGSASGVLLSKWLGDNGADALAQMVGSESMTSSDWMLLALTCQMGQDSQKQVGEAFVRRLLETDDVHPAVAILLGLGESNDAVEVYVSRNYFMEAVLLTCLLFPNDWQRQSYLVRKWGEVAVAQGQPELAVRCFSCTSIESSEPWFSPRAQDAAYEAQQRLQSMSPTSPPSAGNPNRLTTKNASLKLITNFHAKAAQRSQNTAVGVTPIADSALSPGGALPWQRSGSRGLQDPSSARTATPRGYGRRRAASSEVHSRERDLDATPLIGGHSRPGSRTSQKNPSTAIKSHNALPSPAAGIFGGVREQSRPRDDSRDRNYNKLQLDMIPTVESEEAVSSQPATPSARGRHQKAGSFSYRDSESGRTAELSPLMTDGSTRSFKGRNIDRYISSLEEANHHAQQLRTQSRSRNESRDGRSRSRARTQEASETRDKADLVYIKPSKRSPKSPVPMTSDDVKRLSDQDRRTTDRLYEVASPLEARSSKAHGASSKSRPSLNHVIRVESPEGRSSNLRTRSRAPSRGASRTRDHQETVDTLGDRGRSHDRTTKAAAESPTSPYSMNTHPMSTIDDREHDGGLARSRQRSANQRTQELTINVDMPVDRSSRARSSSRKGPRYVEPISATGERYSDEFPTDMAMPRLRELSKKELAAQELEDRRLSLARRPSAPTIPHPGDLLIGRPNMSPRSMTEGSPHGLWSAASFGDLARERSHTADPETSRSNRTTRNPSIGMGLPATPRAMRNSRYATSEADERDAVPAVPAVPENAEKLAPVTHHIPERSNDQLGPLLPSTVYGQKGPPPRSASAPPEQFQSLPQRPRRESIKSSHHVRRASEREGNESRRPSQPENVYNTLTTEPDSHHVIVVDDSNFGPPMLPELQHLAIPPPPPPPPPPSSSNGSSGVINISMDGNSTLGNNVTRSVTPGENNPSTSPIMARRERSSFSGNETFSSKWKNVRDRMRSDSRNRNKSPPMDMSHTPSPYETVLPNIQFQSSGSGFDAGSSSSRTQGTSGGYRNPKEIRAGIQQGMVEGGMI